MQNKKVAVMQPYLFPYIGYFQLINAVNTYVFYDDVQWIKGGWINRHTILSNDRETYASLPTEKHSTFSKINEVRFSDNTKNITDYLNKITNFYRKAPYFSDIYPLIEDIVNYQERNCVGMIARSFKILNQLLNISTECLLASEINYNHNLNAQDKIIDITKKLNGIIYINNINGQHLYNREDFAAQNLTLKFLEKEIEPYKQFDNEFVPYLSIIDILMFNDIETARKMVTKGKLL